MDSYSVIVYLHLLLFVYWLGADVGVFGLALAVRNSNYSIEQRRIFMRLSLTIDMVPRMAMITITPVGMHLAAARGWADIPDWLFIVAWVVAVLWMAGEWIAFKLMGKPEAIKFYIINGIWMMATCFTLMGFGISSLLNDWPISNNWLAVKVMLAGSVFLVASMMAVFYAPLEGIFDRMEAEGSSDEIEALVRSHIFKGGFFTVLLFVLLATIGFLGSVKPF